MKIYTSCHTARGLLGSQTKKMWEKQRIGSTLLKQMGLDHPLVFDMLTRV